MLNRQAVPQRKTKRRTAGSATKAKIPAVSGQMNQQANVITVYAAAGRYERRRQTKAFTKRQRHNASFAEETTAYGYKGTQWLQQATAEMPPRVAHGATGPARCWRSEPGQTRRIGMVVKSTSEKVTGTALAVEQQKARQRRMPKNRIHVARQPVWFRGRCGAAQMPQTQRAARQMKPDNIRPGREMGRTSETTQ